MRLHYESLRSILDEESFKKVVAFCAGFEVVFPKRKIVRDMIVEDYKKLVRSHSKRAAVKILAQKYDRHENHIYKVLKQNGF